MGGAARFCFSLLAAAAALCLGLPLAASRAVGRVSVEPARAILRPGEVVTVAWTALPEGTEEFEILLASRSPMSVKVRLTESMDPGLRSLEWRVPNLPCSLARIFLRVGVEGAGEMGWAWSEPFRIDWEPWGPAQCVTLREGEWWIAEGPRSSRAGIGASGTPRFQGLPALPGTAEAPGKSLLGPAASKRDILPEGTHSPQQALAGLENPVNKPLHPPIRI